MTAPLDQIVAYGIAALTTGGGLSLIVKSVSAALKTRSDAKSARIIAEAKAEEIRAAADADRARAERTEAEGDVMREANLAGLLQEIRDLREANERERKTDRETIAKMQRRLDAQAGEIASLHRAIRRLGGTPTGLNAAASKPDAKE